MGRLGRKGRLLKWVGLVLSSLLLAAWVVSIPWAWFYFRPEAQYHLDPASGQPVFIRYTFILSLSWGSVFHFRDRRTDASLETSTWRVLLDPGWPVWMPYWKRGRLGTRSLVVPLWIPLVLVGIPTVYLIRLDRRRIPPGHCQKCGYNLTGNVSGVCPECGQHLNGATLA
jgi:hypothetical protein